MLILNNIANNIGRLTNATLGETALHCIKMCSICQKSRYPFGYLLIFMPVGLKQRGDICLNGLWMALIFCKIFDIVMGLVICLYKVSDATY